MMAAASAAVPARGGGPGSPSSGSRRPAAADYSVLVVVGALRPVGLLERVLLQIDTGEFWKFNYTGEEPSCSHGTRGGKSAGPFTIKSACELSPQC